MKFKSIKINNFRQFSGENKLEFSINPDKNLTIIHAMNGSGKTTLLQAFNWCLYGKLKLPNADKILNETLFQNLATQQELRVSVILEASHEGVDYIIERSKRVKKMIDGNQRNGEEIFTVRYIDAQGNSKAESGSSAENIINNILPEKLSSYFLFDGERIKNLGENNIQARRDISTGIKNILNIDVYDSLKNILEKKLMPLLHNQIKSEGSEALDKAIHERNMLLQKQEQNKITLEQLQQDIEHLSSQIDELHEKIRLNSEAFELQEEYKNKLSQLSQINTELEEMLYPGKKTSRQSFSKAYTKYTTIKLLKIIKDNVMLNLDTSHVTEEAVPGINANAIDFIIDSRKCICGRKITAHEAEKLSNLKQYLPPHDHRVLVHGFKEKFLEKLNNIEEADNERQIVIDAYFLKEEEKEKLIQDIKVLDRKLRQITDIGHLHTERQAKNQLRNEKSEKIGIIKHQIEENKQKIEKLDTDISLYTRNDEQNKKAQESIDYAKDLIKILNTTIDKKKSDIHHKLNKEVNSVFTSASHKKSKEVIIDTDYNYKIRDKYTGSEALSEGESIITSLSLISAILKIAKDQERAKKNELEASVEYPLVLDAPFAKLDTAHISGIAPLLPQFADQVILFSIDQQFKGVVEKTVQDVIGKQYEMTNNEDKNVYFKELGDA